MAERPARRVLMLAFEDCQVLDVTGPLEILAAANQSERGPAYEIALAAERAGALRTNSGLKLVADRAFGAISDSELEGLHSFIVAGGTGTVKAMGNAALVAFIRRAAARAQRVCSVCSGAALLAAAGLLDGKRATTHWNAVSRIQQAFPAVRLEPDAIFVRDGNIWTSGGVTAGIDLALALVEEDLGRAAALEIARWHVVYLNRPGGQAQFSGDVHADADATGPRTAKVLRFIAAHLDKDLRVPALAAAAGLSERSLLRAFRDELNTTPADYVQRARVDAARRRLSAARGPAKRVAEQCGFASAEVMRRAFHRTLGISPADYRARFATAQRSQA